MDKYVLVVDDDKVTRLILLKYLKKEHIKSLAVSSGEKALSIIRKDHSNIELVIADLMLENMDGLELIKKAKEISPDLDFIMITGQTNINSAIQAMRTGVADYLIKPVQGEDLLFRVKALMEKRQLKEKLMDAEKKLMYNATITTANHEINQPLTVIISGIDIMKMELERSGGLTPQVQNYLNLITKSSQRIASILKKFRQIREPKVMDIPRGMKLIDLEEGLEKKLQQDISILVIEDEQNVKDVLVKILTKYGFNVTAVENGTSALQQAGRHVYDLILMDMNLPDLTYSKLYDGLRSLKKNYKIILMTGYADESEIQELLDKGADDFILKPFDAASLYSKIVNLFKRS